ncbi:MAG: hypothetical protein HKP24_09905 [Croceitalea sp.]|nr:hypothetical protein [Croceitalea sp.]NNM18866.1 hypothetical protein [Croceitalea sp.]
MSVGNPKRFEKFSKLKKQEKKESKETGNVVARLYKDKNYETKKALKFKTDADRSKLS